MFKQAHSNWSIRETQAQTYPDHEVMIYMSWHQTLCPYQSTYYLKLTGHDLCHITSVEPTNNTGSYSPRIRELHRPQSQWLSFFLTVLPIRTQETCTIICHLSRYISDNNWKLAKGHYSFSLRYPCSDKFDRYHKWYKTFVWPKSLHTFNLDLYKYLISTIPIGLVINQTFQHDVFSYKNTDIQQ